MRVDLTCSCGAVLTVAFEHATADKLLEKFRRDHRDCRVSAVAAKEGT